MTASVEVSGADVTVMLCAYQAAKTINTALASVAAQSEPVAAVVVVDDGSTDGTADVVVSWSDELPIDLVQLPENRGHPAARMAAQDRCRTRLVAILDADDAWLPDHVTTMVDAYRVTPGIVAARELLWVPGTGVTIASGPQREVPPPRRQQRRLLRSDFLPIATLFAADDLRRAGGFREAKPEDWDLWIRMVRIGVPVTRAGHPTYLYRVHADSLSFGDNLAADNAALLDRVVEESTTPAERRAARRSSRRLHAAVDLVDAYDAARDGDVSRARSAALAALRHGDGRVRVRAAWMVVAPRAGSRIHDGRIRDLSRRIDQ
jgi:glycosyltransferase involved in cell wall biosynthesis